MMTLNNIIQGDALTTLQTLPDESINCCITSPPYYALRDYQVAGQLGLETTYQEYIEKLCSVFDEVKRVLTTDGTCWVVIGDSYGKDKCLLSIPFRFALEMINRGWILRNTIIWHKPNCMPSSVKDRFTIDFEYVFFFAKSKKYYFDTQYEPYATCWLNDKRIEKIQTQEIENKDTKDYEKAGVQRPASIRDRIHKSMMHPIGGIKHTKGNDNPTYSGNTPKWNTGVSSIGATSGAYNTGGRVGTGDNTRQGSPLGRIKRAVWRITTKPFKQAHFAVYPEDLIEPMIKAGCPMGGVVLDMYLGSGTTAVVAKRLGRNYLGVELNGEYVKICQCRLGEDR